MIVHFAFTSDVGNIWVLLGLPFGLVSKLEMYVFAVIFGITLGPTQSYARVLFAELIPPGQESEFFGIYEITDKVGKGGVGGVTLLRQGCDLFLQ